MVVVEGIALVAFGAAFGYVGFRHARMFLAAVGTVLLVLGGYLALQLGA